MEIEKMKKKTHDGEQYLTVGQVSKLVDRNSQTIKSWYKWCDSEGLSYDKAGLPLYRRDLDVKQTYYFNVNDIEKLIEFRDGIQYGQMSDFNVSRWGERGRIIQASKNESEEAATTLDEVTPAAVE